MPAAAQPGAAPITIVVPYAQNGPTDRTLRAMVAPLSQALGGTPITVKNVASPGGVNGLAEVAAAQPDGRTLLVGHKLSNEIACYAFDPASGAITRQPGTYPVHRPTCIVAG